MADASNAPVIAGCLEQLLLHGNLDMTPNCHGEKWVNAGWLLSQLQRAVEMPGTTHQINLVVDDLDVRRYASTRRLSLTHLVELAHQGKIAEYVDGLDRARDRRKRPAFEGLPSLEVNLDGIDPPGGPEGPGGAGWDPESSNGDENQDIPGIDP